MTPLRGELWLVKLDPTQGSEIRKTRPCLIISNNSHNKINRVLTAIPITSTTMRYPSIQILLSSSNGLENESCLEIPQIRSVDKSRLMKRLGSASPEIMNEIFFKLNNYLGFSYYLKEIDLGACNKN